LIQQLLPAIPSAILRAQAVSAYESATYTLSMLTLRDACSMASSSYNSCSPVDDENNPSEQTTSAKKMEDKVSKAVEVFVGRIQKMENDFIRYEMANDCHGSLWHMILTFLNITALMHSCLRSLFYYIPLTAWNF